MPWIHDDETNTVRCVSEKHNRDLTIQIPRLGEQAVYCTECWRNCLFCTISPGELAQANRVAQANGHPPVTPRMMHFFNPSKPQ